MLARDRPVLIVDDDARTRDVLARIVRVWGFQPREAASVATALASLDPAPECVILDLRLSDGCGEAVLREARARCLECRVIVCSGETDPGVLERLRALGADAVLTKPVAPDELARACLGAERAAAAPVTGDTPGHRPGQSP